MPLPHGICPLTAPPLPGTGPDCRALCAEGRCWGEGPQDCQTREYGARSQFCPPPRDPQSPCSLGSFKIPGSPPSFACPCPIDPYLPPKSWPQRLPGPSTCPPQLPMVPPESLLWRPPPIPPNPHPIDPYLAPKCLPQRPPKSLPRGPPLKPPNPCPGDPHFPLPIPAPLSPPGTQIPTTGPPPPQLPALGTHLPPQLLILGTPTSPGGVGNHHRGPRSPPCPSFPPPPPSNQQHLPRLPTLQGHEADGLLPRAVCRRLHRPQALRLPGVYQGRGAPGTGGYGMPESHTGCRPPPQGVLELQPERDLRAALSPPRHLQLGHLRVGTQPRRAIHLRCQLRQPVSL